MNTRNRIKKYLLSRLSIPAYFKAMQYTRLAKTEPHLADVEIDLPYLFNWSGTKEGHLYWWNLYVTGKKPVETWFTRLIKKIILWLPFLMVLVITSCQKEQTPPPVKSQKVFYKVECADCLITVEDDKWNAGNELERSKNQHFNVVGKWDYEFTNTSLDSVKFSISVSVFSGKQKIKAIVYTNDGHIIDLSGVYGLDGFTEHPLFKEGILNLK